MIKCTICDDTGYVDVGVGRAIENYPCECMEQAAIESAANMGAPKFDRFVEGEDGITTFYDGDEPTLYISTEALKAYNDLVGNNHKIGKK